jgi:phosphoglycolate phosphatase
MMKQVDSIIFDLDGTLWDTCASCAVAWNNVILRHNLNFKEITADDVRQVTGRPHEACIRDTFVGLPENQIQLLIEETIAEDNLVIEQMGAELYEGVKDGIILLAKERPLFIVSNCQSGYIETFLKWSGLEEVFTDFECWGNTGKSKSENLASVIRRNSLKMPIMVGDMESDLIAAKSCNTPFFHMTYGFGKVSECNQAFASFSELVQLILPQYRQNEVSV